MYHGNREYFALKRQLIDEAKHKLDGLPFVCKSNINSNEEDATIKRRRMNSMLPIKIPPTIKQPLNQKPLNEELPAANLVFVYEWFDNNKDVYGYGCDSDGNACRIQPIVEPGLFAITSNFYVLREICSLYGYRVDMYDIKYKANNFALWDLFSNRDLANDCHLVKIITPAVCETMKLYSKFKYDPQSYKFVGVPQYYDVTKQIMFELLLRRLHKHLQSGYLSDNLDYTIPKSVMQWFDKNLNVYDNIPAPDIPIISFDIETVSDDPHRVPTGDAAQDILYSVSIHHTHTNILYSLIYLPLNGYTNKQLNESVLLDGYDVVPDKKVDSSNCENRLECFSNEYDLLVRTMNLMTLGKKLHILLGYNSISYDIKYLLTRCVFYNLYVDKFIWREGYSYGIEQIHLDLFRIIVMRYRFKSYTLNEVSRNIMKDSKTGVSAVALRYSFFKMLKTQKFLIHDESNDKLPSVRDTLHYNNADTLLVSKLQSRTKSIDFIIERAIDCQVPLSTMMTNYNKMQYKLWNECFTVGLNLKIFLTTFKSDIAHVKCPISYTDGSYDFIDVTINLSDRLNANDKLMDIPSQTVVEAPMLHTRYSSTPHKKAKFPGGANFCLGEIDANNVQMYDYVTAYPLLMDRKNISDETLTILPASILQMLYNTIQNNHEYKTYDYLAHNGSTATETIILYYQYIYDGLYCGAEFPFTLEELHKRQDSPVIIIWEGRRGVLSDIVAKFNETRAHTKIMRKILDEAYTLVEEKINCLIEQKQLMDELLVAMTTNQNPLNDVEIVNDLKDTFGFDETEPVAAGGSIDDFGFDDSDNDETDENINNIKKMDEFSQSKDNLDNFGFDDDTDENDSVSITTTKLNEDSKTNFDDFGLDDDDDDNDDCDDNKNVEKNNIDDFGFDDDDDDADGDNAGDDNCNEGNVNDELKPNFSCPKLQIVHNDTEKLKNLCNDDTLSRNPYKFDFVNKYITVYENQMCVINNEELETCDEPIKQLYEILENITLERSKISNSYDLQKSLVSSIYGCVGKMIHVVAAGITCMTRNALLASAQYCQSLNYKVLYLDTDSIMITGCTDDLSGELNRRFPHMEMEMKTARKCMFVKRKTYYKYDDGNLKYGQNVNGPNSWRQCVEYFNSQDHITTNDDIYDSFLKFFKDVYIKLLSFDKVCPEFLDLFTQTIKTKDEYKTMTVAAKFKIYLSSFYPAIAGANKHKIYYYLDQTVMMPCLRPDLDIQSVNDIKNVNLFKYYQNMYTTIFNLIKFHIRRNNAPFKITISSKYVLLIMLKAFLDAYEATFTKNLDNKPTIIVDKTNADEIFCDEIYTKTYDENDNPFD